MQAEGIIPDNLFDLLDEGKGFCSYCIEDMVRNVEWAVEAMVVANQEGYRIVLVFSKSLANVSSLIHPLRARAVFALFVVLVIASFLSLMITRRFAGPINRLTEMAKQLAEGNYAVAFPKGGCYEVEQLSETLEMAAKEFNATEALRREFTANVSHELKTPLQSISGCAELLENGMVRAEDIRPFAGRIHAEARRMTRLVEDIIHLSQLDEGAAPDRETVDLLETAKDAASALGDSATEKGIHVSVSGESVSISGVRSFLHEMIYNLCDNAIKYNVENGSVEITVVRKEQEAVVTVKDTGIGIPAEHQSRIFERFFRVDKSRSKASGGTGLGLSIVKHIAQYHGATIKLQSEFGCGTTVSVVFPL